MTIYADSEYYQETYQGTESVTDSLFREASQMIDLYTFNRIDADDIPDDVKMCCCELSETLLKYNALEDSLFSSDGKIVSSKVGDLSENYAYNTPNLGDLNRRKVRDLRDVIYRWLTDTGLLYRGVR